MQLFRLNNNLCSVFSKEKHMTIALKHLTEVNTSAFNMRKEMLILPIFKIDDETLIFWNKMIRLFIALLELSCSSCKSIRVLD